ncbi:hypothetical protein MSAN_01110800 [Mycena sanguinolenta]|uniref:Protein kinase domain-containing protein n=1 Tax=Mycena sanguinolenta TaxID=230812 RepID=A0A8H6YJ79_9AGAR|nr:hypothetical protein MSAN_01110800 [Mycena sanguinolenta]
MTLTHSLPLPPCPRHVWSLRMNLTLVLLQLERHFSHLRPRTRTQTTTTSLIQFSRPYLAGKATLGNLSSISLAVEEATVGGAGVHGSGGPGGPGEGPTLRYNIRAACLTMRNYTTMQATPSDFLRIPLGSIDLRAEIQLDNAGGMVWRNYGRGGVRRMYAARVECRNTPMTVALYQGDGAEELWRNEISHHARLRHPCILQIYATASSSGIYAAIFHDDLILCKQFLESFRHSAILQVYIYAYMYSDEWEARSHYSWTLSSCGFTNEIHWVRLSTGRLCMEFGTADNDGNPIPIIYERGTLTPPNSMQVLYDPNQESRLIATLGFSQWYALCLRCFTRHRFHDVSVEAEVKMGSIIRWPSGCQYGEATDIAWTVLEPERQSELSRSFWPTCLWYPDWFEVPGDGGCIRYESGELFGSTITPSYNAKDEHAFSWFSQANYILTQLRAFSDFNDYVFIDWIEFSIKIPTPEVNPPAGYLFLRSPTDFQTDPISFPGRPAYWSLDPSGSEPLSVEEASSLGFPSMQLTTKVRVVYWDDTIYAGLRKFHEGKGVDPDSQDVARELGYPLYELSVPIPDVQEEDSVSDAENKIGGPSSCQKYSQDESTPECDDCNDAVAGHHPFGELVELFKFALIIVIAVMRLYERAL